MNSVLKSSKIKYRYSQNEQWNSQQLMQTVIAYISTNYQLFNSFKIIFEITNSNYNIEFEKSTFKKLYSFQRVRFTIQLNENKH